ncbi:hypothetical protein PR048_033331 [Dryococelus australis]|uniref:Uncharacterized protein n=1 Tax=Dryococelus australis TaxID=614101 RepID=A0ABQ9FZZ7_9NEOP|nr:hypothetical protein PR048_033331 [Dryococelus australis]
MLILLMLEDYTMCMVVDLKQSCSKCSVYREQPIMEEDRTSLETQNSQWRVKRGECGAAPECKERRKNGRPAEKPSDQRRCTARFPHAKIPEDDPAEIEPGLPMWEVEYLVQPLHHRGPHACDVLLNGIGDILALLYPEVFEDRLGRSEREYEAAPECKGGGNGRSRRKPADQRHSLTRASRAKKKMAVTPTGNRSQLALEGGE